MSGTDLDVRHKLKNTIKICRRIASELRSKASNNRFEQFCNLLRICMVEDYLRPISSPTAVLETLGLDSSTKLAEWEDIRVGFDKKWETATTCRSIVSFEAVFCVIAPVSRLRLDTKFLIPLIHRVDKAVTSRSRDYIEWYIQ